jgi:hypothetical protein
VIHRLSIGLSNNFSWGRGSVEGFVHHHQPETKEESMQWKYPSSPVAKKFISATIGRQVDVQYLLGFSRAYS